MLVTLQLGSVVQLISVSTLFLMQLLCLVGLTQDHYLDTLHTNT
jgi:hypothetical protein